MSRFYRALLLSVILAFTSIRATAMFAHYTEAQLIESSKLIVIGTLIGHTTLQSSADTAQLNVGVIAIEERLKGDRDESIALLLLPSKDGPLSGDAIHYEIGQQGLWFLRSHDSHARGLHAADHPQRFESMDGITDRVVELKSLLEKAN